MNDGHSTDRRMSIECRRYNETSIAVTGRRGYRGPVQPAHPGAPHGTHPRAEGLAKVPRPCDRFDMIGGTSTGGRRIIAIMLGRLRMTVDECIRAYRTMAERAY
ncbi:predicted protein [Verticillium alfalfae VaMs.102]|uniref:Predicted protein n=1 Tax=Verticillium alfalfae (strain VaMs.102 / ATCC MYA-4576 / FGSC 10136) TaxID=526221 RepID=C9SYZ1_VERA1|nr:predicted protein [Verticillium alfalfae VaMs.102]EEY24006.1 predicted protein [Verticillium alfalfae VaMs.102]